VSEEAKAEALESQASAPAAAEEPEAEPAKSVEVLTPELLAKLWKIIPALWLAGVLVAGAIAGIQLAFLVLAAGVLTLVIALMWSSVQSLTGGASIGFEEALGMGAPSKVEEEKRAVLRALKDLEYERGVGKISPEDYAELSAKYRAEAKRLIQSVDEALKPARSEVERAIGKRLDRAGLSEKLPEITAEAAAETAPKSAPANPAADEEDES
jgi:hypothetical protein